MSCIYFKILTVLSLRQVFVWRRRCFQHSRFAERGCCRQRCVV